MNASERTLAPMIAYSSGVVGSSSAMVNSVQQKTKVSCDETRSIMMVVLLLSCVRHVAYNIERLAGGDW